LQNLWLLAQTAATIGFVHTVVGPDHYLPFIVISRARKWSLPKTLFISFLCGLGHVLSSVVLGFLGIALGLAVGHLEKVESTRGSIASWLLIGFGLVTILTMLVIISLSAWGLSFVRLGSLERYSHALAGAIIFISGLAVLFLGL